MSRASLLVELLCGELPPKLLDDITAQFSKALVEGLAMHEFCDEDSILGCERGHTPRRIAVKVPLVQSYCSPRQEVLKGPPNSVAYTENWQETEVLKKLREKYAPATMMTHVGETHAKIVLQHPAVPLEQEIGAIIHDAIRKVRVPRMMRCPVGADDQYEFVRPIEQICVVHGSNALEVKVRHWKTKGTTDGHRFMSRRTAEITNADDYLGIMRDHNVIVCPKERGEMLLESINGLMLDGSLPLDPELLKENADLCEWPHAVYIPIEEEFWGLPRDVVELVVGKHMRAFPNITHPNTVTGIVFIANNQPKDKELMRRGIAKTLRARLYDANFIYDLDKGLPLSHFYEKQKDRGRGMASEINRQRRICDAIKNHYKNYYKLSLEEEAKAILTATYLKTDQQTKMGEEYPELEGVIGGILFAEIAHCADLLRGHMNPKLDEAPNDVRDVLVLAYVLESACRQIGLYGAPTGAGDRYALRRTMMRALRILSKLSKDARPLMDFVYPLAKSLCEDAKEDDASAEFPQEPHALAKMVIDFALSQTEVRLPELAKRPLSPQLTRAVMSRQEFGTFCVPGAVGLAAAAHDFIDP